jgi:hypothetical protein
MREFDMIDSIISGYCSESISNVIFVVLGVVIVCHVL